ncbi:MAG: hypothetical protein F6K62_11280 [Sphaerospermopsis sp. SIO1G2]|nr:hypothetical protein [Sphaerospermopsis sp. SIO1G2]
MISAAFNTGSVVIELGTGVDQCSDIGRTDIFIAENTLIENAEGSSLNDRLYGNVADNILWGRSGSDRLEGRDGQDTI